MVTAKQRFRVGTFYDPSEHNGKPPRISHIRAYTTWYNSTWKGCKTYDVIAGSGKDAKRISCKARLADELERRAHEGAE